MKKLSSYDIISAYYGFILSVHNIKHFEYRYCAVCALVVNQLKINAFIQTDCV